MTDEEIRAIIDAFLDTVGRTQYIGARYVPTFGRLGEDTWQWDEGAAAYEPLVVVQWRGDSFTSRKEVPAGIDILDEEYWANTGNFNGQLAQVYERLRQLEEPTDYQPQIDALRTDLTTESDTRASEDARIETALNNEIAARGIAEEALQNQIIEEANERRLADTEIRSDMSTEFETQAAQISALQDSLAAETTARTDADADLTLGVDRLEDFASRLLMGGTVTPTYVGSFEGDEQHASCLRVGSEMYTFSPNNYDGMGTVRIWNLLSNTLTRTANVLIGHGNSVCYDTVRNCIWLAPMSTYASGTATPTNTIYRYNLAMSSRTDVQAPERAYGVSFDPTTNDLYLVNTTNGTSEIRVWRMRSDEDTFTLYRTITDTQFANVGLTAAILWQDFAVYDSVLLAGKLDGTTYVIPLDEDEPSVQGTFRIGFVDSGNLWKYGEVEGFEFDAEGRLYCMRTCPCGFTNTGALHQRSVGFVTELNTRVDAQPNDCCQLTFYGTMTLVPATQFSLNRYECHSMNEMMWRADQNWRAVNVPAGMTMEIDKWRVNKTCELNVLGTLNVNNELEIDSGDFVLYINEGTVNHNGSTALIDCAGSPSNVKFRCRNGYLNMANDVDLITSGYVPNIISVNGIDNMESYKINGNVRTKIGMYLGSYTIWTPAD